MTSHGWFWDTMGDKFICYYIPNDNKQNYDFCNFKLLVETFWLWKFEPINQVSMKVLKSTNVNMFSSCSST